MGGVILVAILIVVVMILVSRTWRDKGRARVEQTEAAARNAVVRSLEDRRKMRDKHDQDAS